MGSAESKILANRIISACDRATEEGKDQLDQDWFWQDAEIIRVSKILYKSIPGDIRGPRQSAVRKAISHRSQKVEIPLIVKKLQSGQESLFPRDSEQESASNHASRLPQPHSVFHLYNVIVCCEEQQQLDRFRCRISCVALFWLKNAIVPGSNYGNDASIFIASVIKDSGCEDELCIIQNRVRLWIDRGDRYTLIANDLGGVGVLYVLPEDYGESLWTKDLAKNGENPDRRLMINHLRALELPEAAQNLHKIVENEVFAIFNPAKDRLDLFLQSQLSEPKIPKAKRRRLSKTQGNRPLPGGPQLRQPVIGLSYFRSLFVHRKLTIT
ncbi:hypothetical protein N7540_012500 [Penicillium herquei]|nr:hypothetical protein N7540_012500 [Penicillium herquei]